MKLIGFNFTKINIEKKSDNLKDLKISTGINILDLKEAKTEFFNSSDNLIIIKFEYLLNYDKDIATLNFNGNLAVSINPTESKEILEQWKNKKIPEKFRLSVFNIILRKSSLKALQFEEEFNLPPHISMPSFSSAEKK